MEIGTIFMLMLVAGTFAALVSAFNPVLSQRLMGLIFAIGFGAFGVWSYNLAAGFAVSQWLRYVGPAIAGVCVLICLSMVAGYGVKEVGEHEI